MASYTPAQIAQMRADTEILVALGERRSVQQELELKKNQQILAFLEKSATYLQDQVDGAENLLGIYKQIEHTVAGSHLVSQQRLHLEEEKLRLTDQTLKDHKLLAEYMKKFGLSEKAALKELLKQQQTQERNIELFKAQVEFQDEFTASAKEGAEAWKEINAEMIGATSVYTGAFDIRKGKKYWKAMAGMSAGGFFSALNKLSTGILISVINNIVNLAIAMHDAEGKFRKTTGATAGMAREMTGVYEATRGAGVSIEEASKAMEGLYRNFTDFTMLAPQTRAELGKTGAVLAELGVSNEAFAKGIQVSTKMLGQGVIEANKTAMELKDFATNLGVPVDTLSEKYASMGPSLAKLGDQGTKAFKDLAHISKITGLEMEKVLRITDKFDTFEGAAEQAGKLNAALGGNFVNAMDLMMATDPAERFGMIRDSLLDAGLSFDDMSYYQRKFYADSLGLEDVGDLALMMSGNMDTLAGTTNKTTADYEKMAAQALATQTLQDKFNATLADMVPILLPLIDWIADLAEKLNKKKDLIKELIVGAVKLAAFLKLLGIAIAIVTAPAWAMWLAIGALIAVVVVFWDEIKKVSDLLFKDDAGASTFLEGLWKFAHSFEAIGGVMKAILNPIDTLKSVFAALTDVMFKPLQMLNSMMENLRDPAIATNVEKIAAAIDQIPTTKAVALMYTAGAVGVANTVASAVTAPMQIARGAMGGGGGATQTVRQPIELKIGERTMGNFVLDVIGKEITAINVSQS